MLTEAEKQRRYRKRHKHEVVFKARVKAEKRRSYERNKAKALARSQKWAEAHRDRTRAISRAHYMSHLDEQRERCRNKAPELRRAAWKRYHVLHHERFLILKVASQGRRRAQKVQTAIGPIDYGIVTREARGVCGICREPIGMERTQFDHIVPLARGGAHIQANLQLAHARCNARKGARSRMAA